MSAEQYWRITEATALYAWWGVPFFVGLMVFACGYIGLFQVSMLVGCKVSNLVIHLRGAPPRSAKLIAFAMCPIGTLGILVALAIGGPHRGAAAKIAEFLGFSIGTAGAELLDVLLVIAALLFLGGLSAGCFAVYVRHWIFERAERSDKQKSETA